MSVLRMFRGDNRTYNLAFTKNGAAQNIAGFSIWVTGKRAIADADPAAVFQKSTGSGTVTITDAPGGLAIFSLLPADTSGFEASRVELACDVQIKDTQGNIVTASYFTLIVDPDVTRAT